jgi:hypothetical protein
VKSKPDGPPETYHCTYLIDWVNQSVRNYEGAIENARALFDTKQQQWDESMTCAAFASHFRQLLTGAGKTRRVRKIVCFGLGDLHSRPPAWWKIQNKDLPENQQEPETSIVDSALVHHAIALTMANIVRSCADPSPAEEEKGVRLLTQDPDYCEETKEMIQEMGFEVVGGYGAGGFAEIDDESVVFSTFTEAPVKQIIADLACCPLIIISARDTVDGVWNSHGYVFHLFLLPYPSWAKLTLDLYLESHGLTLNLPGQDRCGRVMRIGLFQIHLIVARWEVRYISWKYFVELEKILT